MHDVAEKAGVSQMTVSRVLREEGFFSSDVKQRVLDASAALGYIHNRLASIQRGMDNPMVGVVLPTLKNIVFTEVLAGINDTLSELEIRPVFGVSEYSAKEEEKLIMDMLSWRPRGLILSGTEHTPASREILLNAGIPVAETMDADGEPISSTFGILHQEVGRAMAQHFLERGYKRVAYLGAHGGRDIRASKRARAFQVQLEAGGGVLINALVASQPSSMNLGRILAEECLRSSTKPDAVYCANDDIAAGVLMHCISLKIDVPGELAIAGFNGLPFLESLPLRITTTHTPRYEMGRRAARFVAGLQDEQIENVGLEAKLKIGQTT